MENENENERKQTNPNPDFAKDFRDDLKLEQLFAGLCKIVPVSEENAGFTDEMLDEIFSKKEKGGKFMILEKVRQKLELNVAISERSGSLTQRWLIQRIIIDEGENVPSEPQNIVPS